MSVQSVCQASRAQPAQRSRTGSRFCCAVVAITLALAGWHSSQDGADMRTAFASKDSGEDVAAVVKKVLPGALPSYEVFTTVRNALKPFGARSNNVIFATSIPPDEINGAKGQLSVIMAHYFGNLFTMGGLGGFPFVGKTGFDTFSAHVPDNGHVVVLFGPHIGFSPEAEAGKFLRHGQSKESSACGALMDAYNQIGAGDDRADDPQDMQQAWLRERMAPHYEAASNSSDPMAQWVMSAYKEVEKEIMDIVHTDFGSGNLVLLGGVSVNLPAPTPGYFLPLHFSVRSTTSGPHDLRSKLR